MPLDQQSLERLKIDREDRGAAGRPIFRWVVLVVIILALLVGLSRWTGMGGRVLEVRTASVRELSSADGSGERTVLNASGYVVARREATVSAKVTGKVVEILVEEGKRVEADQVVARLDSSNVMANKRLAEAQLGSARLAVKETQALLDQAESNLRRVAQLVQGKISPASDLDKADSDFRSLRARAERQTLEITVAERSIALWDQQLEDMVIRAPFAGVVTAKNAQPGEVVSPMSAGGFTRTGVCTLVDMDSLEIEVDVNESYLNRVTPGQRVEAALDAYPDWKMPAKVIAIIPTADRQKATVRVRVGFEKLDPRILPQMGVKVAFRGAEEPKTNSASVRVLVPKSAVVERNGQSLVFVVKDGRVDRRAVKAGPFGSEELQVMAGLKNGERVVLDPPAEMKEGTTVRERKL